MNFHAFLSGLTVLSLSFMAPTSYAEYCGNESLECSGGFGNQSMTGCYVFSYNGHTLGPAVTSKTAPVRQPSDTAELVSQGWSTLGRLCFDGAGNTQHVSGTANFAGLCTDTYSGSGTYEVRKDGTGTGSVFLTVDTVTEGCPTLGIQQGDDQIFQFNFVIGSKRDCVKTILTRAATVDSQGILVPHPIVAEGEACPQFGAR